MLRHALGFAVALSVFSVIVIASGSGSPREAQQLPEMKFNDVAEVAPGVFFRYSSISATDPKVPFGGCNNTWVVCKDFVVVIDANFPKEAADVLAAIRKTTDKPIRYVLDTHHHGDHAYGNCVWAKEGAKIVAHTQAARLLQVNGPKQWAEASRGREDIKQNELKQADVSFSEPYVIDDGMQRVEFHHFGHAHTRGDAVAFLPKHKLLCTGDACVNGAFNYMGHADSASWIQALEKMQKLDVERICPGHGRLATKTLLSKQQKYFVELRAEVKKGMDQGKSLNDIGSGIEMTWYKEWTGKAASENKDNIKHVYDELQGKIDHDRLGKVEQPSEWTPGRSNSNASIAAP